MSETKFTPGPWVVEIDPCHFGTLSTVVAGEIGKEGFNRMVVQLGGWSDFKEQESNAHLIAAAPDLYEALEDACDMLDRLGHLSAEYRAVLAKARGEG